MQVIPIKTRVFREGEDLFKFITQHIQSLKEGSIVVITSKIVALAEKRTAEKLTVKTKGELIKQESDVAIPTKYVWLTVKDGLLMASAGIDESNAEAGKLILLPKDSFKVARELMVGLQKKYKIKRLGVLITDSRTVPLRVGIAGVALGYAGFRGLKDYRGTADLFGRKFRFATANIADGLSTAAVLVMGEGAEQQPLVVIEEAPVEFRKHIRKNELYIDIENDMYRPFFDSL